MRLTIKDTERDDFTWSQFNDGIIVIDAFKGARIARQMTPNVYAALLALQEAMVKDGAVVTG